MNDTQGAVRSGTQGAEAQSCPALPTGVQQPTLLQTSWSPLPHLANTHMARTVADEAALFWMDGAGAVYRWPHGSDQAPTKLHAATSESRTLLQFMASDTHLVWTDAGVHAEPVLGIAPPPAPGRLYSMPKQGGKPELLRESADTLMRLVAATSDRVWFLEPEPDGEEVLYSLTRADGSVTAFTTSGQRDPQVVADHVYWWTESEGSSDESGYFQDLFRQDLNGGQPELVTAIEGWSYDVIGPRVAWVREATLFEPLVLQEQVVTFDTNTGCQHVLPSDGLSISAGSRLPLVDATHVYWLSFNALGAVTNPTPAEGHEAPASSPQPGLPLLRVGLENGALEQFQIDGLRIPLGGDMLVAQTPQYIYVRGENGLVRVNKPSLP